MVPSMVNTRNLIIGGDLVAPGAYPAFAFPIGANGYCGGTLIWEDIVVTAASCYGFFTGIEIYLGTPYLNGTGALDTKVGLQEYPHPYYEMYTNKNNIMLVKLDSPSLVVTPKAWNTNPNVPAVGDPVTAIGFGIQYLSLGFSTVLRQVELGVVDSDTCAADYEDEEDFYVEPDVELCAGETEKGIYYGDE